MKILHIISSFDPAGGGPVEAIKQVSAALAQQGHTNEVLSADDPNAPYVLDAPLPIHALGPGKSFYKYSPKIKPWLRENAQSYDLIFVRGLWRYVSYASWSTLKPLDKPYFVFVHGMLDPWFKQHYPIKHLKKYIYWLLAEYRVLRDAKAVLFTSKQEKLLARKSFWPYHCKETLIKYGTKGPSKSIKELKSQFLAQYPELVNKRIVLFLGRIHEKKGCELLVEAFAHTMKNFSDFHLIIAGPDQVRLQIKLLQQAKSLGVEKRISWLGMLSAEKKWEALASAEVFVLPSHQENFGIAVAEALSCSLPVLLSKKVNIWEEVVSNRAGLADEDTLEGTINLLNAWINLSAEEKQQMRKTALDSFVNHFEIKAAAEDLIKLSTQ